MGINGVIMEDDSTPNLDRTPVTTDGFILAIIDEALEELGSEVRDVLYFGLERVHHLSKQDIPKKLHAFDKAIDSLLGVGGLQLKSVILDVAARKLGLPIGTKTEFLAQMLIIRKRIDATIIKEP